jgi:hypothetical protein
MISSDTMRRIMTEINLRKLAKKAEDASVTFFDGYQQSDLGPIHLSPPKRKIKGALYS